MEIKGYSRVVCGKNIHCYMTSLFNLEMDAPFLMKTGASFLTIIHMIIPFLNLIGAL